MNSHQGEIMRMILGHSGIKTEEIAQLIGCSQYEVNQALEDVYNLLSVLAFKNDVETIKSLILMTACPVISLGIVPYTALFCSEFEDYNNKNGNAVSIQNDSSYNINDIRAKIKLFDERHGKRQKQILLSDTLQNQIMSEKLRFPWMRGLNIHKNLGVFSDEQGHIIGNTQYTFFLFQDRKFSKPLDDPEDIRQLGKALGTAVNSISAGLAKIPVLYEMNLMPKAFQVFYKDFNTNRSFNAFPNVKNGKELTLELLHILSFVNFVRYVIRPIVPQENPWLLRVTYITAYYAETNLLKIVEMPENSELKTRLGQYLCFPFELYDSEFRSCMMHYGFKNHGEWSIEKDNIDLGKRFFGLIESRFAGLSYNEFYICISRRIDEISDAIGHVLSIDMTGKKLLK